MPACRRDRPEAPTTSLQILTRAALPFLLALSLAGLRPAAAATPAGGTLNAGNPSVNWTGSISGAGSGENTCVNGVSCDSFQVVLSPGDYTDRQLSIAITWTLPAYDYDLYVHEGTLGGPVHPAANGGPPTTEEHVLLSLSPGVVTSPRVWWAHVQAASVPPGQTYHGTAALVSLPNAPSVTYLTGHLTFCPPVPLYAFATARDEEPSVRVDARGNCYVGGIRGVPAGVDMWRFDLDPASPGFDPQMRNGTYLGQPDVFTQAGAADSAAGGADGGGDIDFCTSHPATPGETPVLTMVSLAVANISSNTSSDRGDNWVHNPAAASIASDDRQWVDSFGPDTVYLFYRGLVPLSTLYVAKSIDHGRTYLPSVPVLNAQDPAGTTPGYICVDPHDGTVYVSHLNSDALYVSRSTDGGQTWTTALVDDRTGHGHLFDVVKVGDDGTVYTVWSNDRHILYSYSSDHGATWSSPGIVENPALTQTNVFPWIAAGSAGRIAVVWFGTPAPNVDAAEWDVWLAQSLDANTGTPTFRQQRLSDHPIHGSNISEGGLTGAANRNLGDYFQVDIDPQGAAVVAFADDHNDFDGNTYVTRQLDGTSLLAAANGNGQVLPVPRTELSLPDFTQPQVLDPAHDATYETQVFPADYPFDIVSIRYFMDFESPSAPLLCATMQLSGLAAAPPPGQWRIGFTANAPWATSLSPTGLSDRGDMFYFLASDSGGVRRFRYGTAYRDSAAGVPVVSAAYAMAYNPPAGDADFGSIDTSTSRVTVKVALSRLNALLPPGHAPIGERSWLVGLRGSAAPLGGGYRDNTRGGLYNFLVHLSTAGVPAGGAPLAAALSAWPNPCREDAVLRYAVPAREHVTLAVYDVQGKLVRTLSSSVTEPGEYLLRWDGRGNRGEEVATGVYFARLRAGGQEKVTRIVRFR